MYGIEKLKEVAADIAKFGMKIDEALEDRRLSFVEAVNLGIFAVPKVMGYVPDAEQIKNEFSDLDGAETVALAAHVADTLDLTSDVIEGIVEAGLEVLASLNKLRLVIKDARTPEDPV